MCIAPKIIVFTRNKYNFIENNKEYKNKNNKFYKVGGIAVEFSRINNFIKSDETDFIEEKIGKETSNNPGEVQLIFDYIDKKEQLMLPMFFKVLIEDTLYNDMKSYTNFLYNIYSEDNDKIKSLLGSIRTIPNIPIEILSKYYARLYTLDSNFHRDLNRNLGLNKLEKYLTYVKLLYEGVKYKSLPLSSINTLYRGSKISKVEINKINSYLNNNQIFEIPIVFSKSFLSFSKSKEIAESFINTTNVDQSLYQVLFILEKNDTIKYNLSTHGDIEHISYFPEEKEVLFFPFSAFEIKEINPIKIGEKTIYEIKLLYLGKYLKDIEKDKNLVKKENKLPNSEFKKHILEFGLIKAEKVENMTTKKLFEEFLKYSKDIGNCKKIDNFIKGEIKIGQEDINKEIRIINSYDNVKKSLKEKIKKEEEYYKNEKELKENIEIKINGENIKFSYFYKFEEEGDYKIDYLFKKDLTNANHIFYDCETLTNLDLSEFNSENINNLKCMFYNCKSLIDLNLSNFITNNVEDMSHIFEGCSSLINLDLSKIKTDKAIYMNRMFKDCKSIKSLDLSKFITKNVIDMNNMFSGCNSLEKINITTKFKTFNVKNMDSMFYYCNSLKSLDLSNFNTQQVINMSNMFYYCPSLISLNLSKFNTKNVINMKNMFYNCSSLISLDLSSFNTKNVTNMSYLFSSCKSLISLDLSNFDTQKVIDMKKIFSGCESLKSLDLSNFKTQNITDMEGMFDFCNSLYKDNVINNDNNILNQLKYI